MLLGFKRQFVPFIIDGTKTHTIRARGNRRRFAPGDICHCYVDPRQKSMTLIGRFVCTVVQEIVIETSAGPGLRVSIDGVYLDADEVEAFFRRDGFRPSSGSASRAAALFWHLQLNKPFVGDLIHWDFRENHVALTSIRRWMRLTRRKAASR